MGWSHSASPCRFLSPQHSHCWVFAWPSSGMTQTCFSQLWSGGKHFFWETLFFHYSAPQSSQTYNLHNWSPWSFLCTDKFCWRKLRAIFHGRPTQRRGTGVHLAGLTRSHLHMSPCLIWPHKPSRLLAKAGNIPWTAGLLGLRTDEETVDGWEPDTAEKWRLLKATSQQRELRSRVRSGHAQISWRKRESTKWESGMCDKFLA